MQVLSAGICAERDDCRAKQTDVQCLCSCTFDRIGNDASYACEGEMVLYTSSPGGLCLWEHTLYAPQQPSQSPAMCRAADGSGAQEKMTLGRSLPGGTAEAKTSFSISQNQSRPCNGAT